jgi:hypothetical protein
MGVLLLTIICDPLPSESAARHLLDEIDLLSGQKLLHKRVLEYPKFEHCWKLEAEYPTVSVHKKAQAFALQLCAPWHISIEEDDGTIECLFNRATDSVFGKPVFSVIRWAQILGTELHRPN